MENNEQSKSDTDYRVTQLRDVLSHYHDQAYLSQHPILKELKPLLGNDQQSAVLELRRLLARAIESVRPEPETPTDDPAWRPYTFLHYRYILGRDIHEVETAMALGRRQLMREQKRGLDALVSVLWKSMPSPEQTEVEPSSPENSLFAEISRVASQRQGIDAQEILREVLDIMRPLANSYSVHITNEYDYVPYYVYVNSSLFRQLMLTLLSFTIRSVAEGTISLTFSALNSDNKMLIIVAKGSKNTGSIRLPESLPEPAITLAQALGISLLLQPQTDYYQISITLPSTQHSPVIALIEDNEDSAKLFSRYIVGRGYSFIHFSSSENALANLTKTRPDVVILDLMMSGTDGWKILQEIKADPQLHRTPVIVCSVIYEPELAKAIGAEICLRKPVRASQLLNCLAQILGN